MEFVADLLAGHGGEGAERPDGVQVAEEKDGFASGAGGAEAELEDISEVFLFVSFDASAELASPAFDEGSGGVEGGFVLAGGLLLDKGMEVGLDPVGMGLNLCEDCLGLHGGRVSQAGWIVP